MRLSQKQSRMKEDSCRWRENYHLIASLPSISLQIYFGIQEIIPYAVLTLEVLVGHRDTHNQGYVPGPLVSFVHQKGLNGGEGGRSEYSCEASVCATRKEGGTIGHTVRPCPFNMCCDLQPRKSKTLVCLSSDQKLS